jgi:hypothetical protein
VEPSLCVACMGLTLAELISSKDESRTKLTLSHCVFLFLLSVTFFLCSATVSHPQKLNASLGVFSVTCDREMDITCLQM